MMNILAAWQIIVIISYSNDSFRKEEKWCNISNSIFCRLRCRLHRAPSIHAKRNDILLSGDTVHDCI